MANYIFPAIFDPGDDGEDGYTVTFPDLLGCITEGDDMEEAVFMAKDALAGFLFVMEEDDDPIPAASKPGDIELLPGAFVSIIEV